MENGSRQHRLPRGDLTGTITALPINSPDNNSKLAHATTVELFHGGKRVTSHARNSAAYRHTTINGHMPKSHQAHREMDAVAADLLGRDHRTGHGGGDSHHSRQQASSGKCDIGLAWESYALPRLTPMIGWKQPANAPSNYRHLPSPSYTPF